MSSPHTVPALREQAQRVRAKAEEVLSHAARQAEDLRAAADEIDAMADAKLGAAPEPHALACWNCRQPIVHDELGWRHAPDAEPNMCQVPGPNERDAALPPVAAGSQSEVGS